MPDNNDEAVEPKGEKNQAPKSAAPERTLIDPNDVVPVPVAMEPAEIEERAKAVEAVRERQEEIRDRVEPLRGRKSVMGDDPDRDESRGRR